MQHCIRVLLAYEDEYRAYREVISAGIQIVRPHVEVDISSLEALEESIERFDPHLVICSQPNTYDPGGRPAWVENSVNNVRMPSTICVGGHCSKRADLSFEMLLEVIDGVEKLVQTENYRRGC